MALNREGFTSYTGLNLPLKGAQEAARAYWDVDPASAKALFAPGGAWAGIDPRKEFIAKRQLENPFQAMQGIPGLKWNMSPAGWEAERRKVKTWTGYDIGEMPSSGVNFTSTGPKMQLGLWGLNAGQPYAGISPQNAKAMQAAWEKQMQYENSKKKGFFDQFKEALPVISLGLPVIGPAIGASISGALQGTSLGNAFEAITSALGKLPAPVSNALKGAAMSGISGGNPLKGALAGGLGGLGGMAAEGLGFSPQLGSMLAKQGYGLYRLNQAQDQYNRAMQQRQLARMSRGPFPQRTV